jgi:hypothetical protein
VIRTTQRTLEVALEGVDCLQLRQLRADHAAAGDYPLVVDADPLLRGCVTCGSVIFRVSET